VADHPSAMVAQPPNGIETTCTKRPYDERVLVYRWGGAKHQCSLENRRNPG
jgi:hypothetical protein